MPNEIKPLNFSLFDLERAIAQRDYANFEACFIELLIFIDKRADIESTFHTDENGQTKCSHRGLAPFTNQLSFNEKVDLYSRLAATITTYLSDTAYMPKDDILIRFVAFKTHITSIFYLSCYGNADHILFNRGLSDSTNSLNLKTDQDIKFLYVCLSLNSHIEFDVKMLVDAIPVWGMYWYLGLLYGHQHSYNPRIESNLNKLVDAHALIQDMVLDDTAVEMAASPWMLCSYLDRPDRHEIKKSINVAIQKWLKSKITPRGTKKIARYIEKTTDIKKVVVLSEKYTSKHAMYRCYHLPISELKNHFDVTVFSGEQDIDTNSEKDFHRLIKVTDSTTAITSIIKKIAAIEPDLIIFPSLGMAKWTIPLCNIRLAKYQMMCYGHPASAESEYIDYGYTSGLLQGPDYQSLCHEVHPPIYHETNEVAFQTHPELIKFEKEFSSDSVVRIAINSSLPKISSRFISLCNLIRQHSSLPIEFHFFLISSNLAFEKSALERLGSAAKIYPPTDYPTYMNNLSRCDLAIGTFPFGGTNTNIDLAILGIPKVYYSEKCGLASYTDQSVLRKLKLPDILKPETEVALLSNLIYLIHDARKRLEISENITSQQPENLFIHKELKDNTLVKSINWITQSHSIYP